MTTGSERFQVVERLVSCDLGDEAVVLKLDGGIYYGLNDSGSLVWKLLQEAPRTAAELADAIEAEYEVDRERCEADVRLLLESMVREQLVEERG